MSIDDTEYEYIANRNKEPDKEPIKPEVCGCDDGTFWYRCPGCHDPLDYKQSECLWCHKKIDWDGELK